jgi:myo-inositol-1-phosphate synthase
MDDACDTFLAEQFVVQSDKVKYTAEHILAEYEYQSTMVEAKDGKIKVTPKVDTFEFQTERKVPKLGIMLVGLGGNNGTTFTAGIIANRKGLTWQTKEREIKSNYLGSLTQASTVRLGSNSAGDPVYVPLKNLLPMVEPNDVVVGGWDICGMPLGDAMKKAKVLDVDLQRQLYEEMNKITPLPSCFFPSFIAVNQRDRANHVLTGSKQEQMNEIRKNIRDFKLANGCDKVIVLWTANTERFAEIQTGVNDTSANLLAAIERGEEEISPSTVFAVACILEGTSFINGSPQNTFVPGCLELADQRQVYIGGDDFKSGQTKMKSVLVDFLIGSGALVCTSASLSASLSAATHMCLNGHSGEQVHRDVHPSTRALLTLFSHSFDSEVAPCCVCVL